MKPILAITLCLTMLLSTAACGSGSLSSGNAVIPTAPATQPSQTDAPTQPEPSETTVPSEPAQTLPSQTDPPASSWQIPLTAIAMPQILEHETLETGELVFSYCYPDITFLHSDTQVARNVVLDLRNRIERSRADAEALKTQAQNILSATAQAPGYSMEIRCDPMRVDQSILSVQLIRKVFSGGYQPEESTQPVTYDLSSGKPLELSQLLSQDASHDRLVQMLTEALSQSKNLYGWYDEILEELFSGNTLPENWYLSAHGLCFRFSAYEIAPQAVEVTLPYLQLAGMIKDRYYPPEIPEATGQILAEEFRSADLSRFSAFAELMLDDTEAAYLFYTDQTITQLRIDQVIFNPKTGTFEAYNTAFATDVLTPVHAVRLAYVFPGDLASVQIRYVSNGQEHVRFLHLSGEDGQVFLSE